MGMYAQKPCLGQIEEFDQNYYEFWDRKCEVNPAA